MAHPNEELVRRGFDAFSKGDVDTLRDLFDPDAVWHAPGRSPLSGEHRGVDDILDFFARTMERTAGIFRVELHDVVANDEHAVALYVARGEREGRTLEDKSVLASHVRIGKFVETWQHSEDRYAATSSSHGHLSWRLTCNAVRLRQAVVAGPMTSRTGAPLLRAFAAGQSRITIAHGTAVVSCCPLLHAPDAAGS